MQLGGQTPLGLAQALKDAGVPIVGTSPEAIDLAEDRGAFGRVLAAAGLPAPKHGTATSFDEAKAIADDDRLPGAGPAVATCSAGAAWRSSTTTTMLRDYIERATEISPEHPVLVDRFLDDAIEIDVDALFDGTELYLGGVMEHIEEAGIHSGDSACALPPITLGRADIDRIRASTEAIARGVGVRGLLNVQYALAADVLYVLEANPRASRTVPFVSKATGGAAGQGGRPGHARRDDRRAAGRGAAARERRRRRPAARRADRRSRRRCCRSAGSTASTRCSARRCVDRRGHGHRRRLRHRVRQVAGRGVRRRCRPRARSSSRWPTATSGR